MPHLYFRGLSAELVQAIGVSLEEELSAIIGCETSDLMMEVLHTTCVAGGRIAPSYPFVEVAWFERGRETRDAVARSLDAHIRGQGVAEVEIAFRAYKPSEYYANGEPFGADPAEAELQALRADHAKLKEELARARKAAATAASGGTMSSRLRDALRE
ncbi:DUF1904 family protein [Cohnella sp. JJ-181]|uniref:DUF1904 family protein n=1 Tax=Cohnella rhizoplanae TaxID=2974897 RepID=UPI0022FF77BE|nr:DUF1904 family protein [Cohnella sp. JJ-181]CAI6080515.1 hypothetical protein COHCIP112018_03010 [Cohnella sp. JJ-181]